MKVILFLGCPNIFLRYIYKVPIGANTMENNFKLERTLKHALYGMLPVKDQERLAKNHNENPMNYTGASLILEGITGLPLYIGIGGNNLESSIIGGVLLADALLRLVGNIPMYPDYKIEPFGSVLFHPLTKAIGKYIK